MLRAFHNDVVVQALYLGRVRAHRAADEIIHGTYWETGKGCAVGCTLHSGHHDAYEAELGIPTVLAHLEDSIFERLPAPEDTAWPEDFLSAPRLGADLSLVWPRFAVALLTDPDDGVLQYVQAPCWHQQRTAIVAVSALYQQKIEHAAAGAPEAAAGALEAAAGAPEAAAGALEAAAEAAEAAAWALEAATGAPEAAAGGAAWAARAAEAGAGAARAAARAAEAGAGAAKKTVLWQRNLLLRLLREAPIP